MAAEKKVIKPAEEKKPKKTIHRSPNYPAFDLGEAIAKAKILWEKDHKAGSTTEAALQHLGFKGDRSPSGPAGRTLSTLKKFGLTEEIEGRIHLSQLGLDLVIYPETDERYIKARGQAALKPSIYAKIYAKFQAGLPSDETLKSELVRDEGFNPKQVDVFLADFRRTIELAGLEFGTRSTEEEMQDSQSTRQDQAGHPAGAKTFPSVLATLGKPTLASSFPIPLRKQNQAVIGFSRLPLDKSDLDLLKQWIDLMAENLTEVLDEENSN